MTTPASSKLLNRRLVYVGTDAGIHLFALVIASGELEPLGVVEGVRHASYLAFDPAHRFLYAVNEMQEFEGEASGAVSAFAVDQEDGDLTFLNQKASHGTDPCHLVVDPAGRHVFVANYSSGSVCVLPIGGDGALGNATDVVQHAGSGVDQERQAGPHAHCVAFDHRGRYVFVADLGLDQVAVYQYDAARGKLITRRDLWVATAPGAGPRHVAFHPRSGFVYVLNELDSTVSALRYDDATGTLEPLQTAPALPADFSGENTAAAVQVSPSGKFLYASNRGHDSIAVFAIDEQDGTLAPVEHVRTQGRTPRDFAISPDGRFLIAANQESNSLVTFRIDAASGRLTPSGYAVEVAAPACVKVISAPPGTVPADLDAA